jgi:ribosomal protein S18 acetylase RimI-like enzyme
MAPRVRRLALGEVALLRDLRLRALADSPMAFGSTLAREQGFPQAEWERRAAEGAAGERQAAFVAEPDAGLAVGMLADDEPGAAGLYAMWVAPRARGTGAGRALVDAVVAWAAARGVRVLRTAVTEGNASAMALYTRAGFLDTGAREPLGHSGAIVVVLARDLP